MPFQGIAPAVMRPLRTKYNDTRILDKNSNIFIGTPAITRQAEVPILTERRLVRSLQTITKP